MAAFKDEISPAMVDRLGAAVLRVWPEFPVGDFQARAVDGLEALALTARIDHVAQALTATMPADFADAAPVVSALAASGDLHGWVSLAVNSYVTLAGIDHPEVALPLLAQLTEHFSSEFAIRPFIERHPEVALQHLRSWCDDPSEHVRRLVSEGTRPRLPWAPLLRGFIADPRPSLEWLDRLVDDESPYVRRSVANHLNDIAKDHPDLAIDVATRWLPRPHGPWIVRHGLRMLVKRGNPRALVLLGFPAEHDVSLARLAVSPDTVRIGEAVRVVFTLDCVTPVDVVIDYVVHYQGAKGPKAGKVFKLTQRRLVPGEPVSIERSHRIEHVSIRRIHTGPHRIEVQVNGRVLGGAVFDVVQ